MKSKTILYYLLISAFAFSCKKDVPGTDTLQGTLTLNVGLFLSVNEEENTLKSTLGAEDFHVTIYNSQGIEITVYPKASDIPPEISLDPGQYYVTAHSNNDLPAAFENPYYYGESAVFTITPGGQQSITVNCEMANTRVAIVYSEQVKSNFSDYSATVSTSAGSLIFTRDEVRAGYFQPLPISISVVLTWVKQDGTTGTKVLTGNIPVPQPRKSYEIHVNASTNGSSAILIDLDESVDPVEIVNITDSDPVSGVINTGDLLITEIMYDPVSLADPEGEWFEIYNNTSETIDLHHLVIRKNDTQSHVINESIQLPSHEYFVFARTDIAVQGSKYIYGTSISLNNTDPVVLALHNYGTDGTNGSVIISLNYRSEGFPDGTGTSISLSPDYLNYSSAVSGDSWCTSTSAYITGDLGTPGVQNDDCL